MLQSGDVCHWAEHQRWVMDGFIEHWSYLGIIVVLVLTGCGLPIPEEVAIIAAGILSADPDGLNPYLAFGSCMIGALLGDCVMYYIGRRFGRSVLKEHPRWAGFMTPERERRIERMIQQHGFKVFLVARFLVGLRSPVYVTAGILHVPFARYLAMDLVCATLVIGLFFGLSYMYGDWITNWIRRAELVFTVLVVAGAVVGLLFYWRHRRRLKRLELQALEKIAPPEPARPAEATRRDETKHVA